MLVDGMPAPSRTRGVLLDDRDFPAHSEPFPPPLLDSWLHSHSFPPPNPSKHECLDVFYSTLFCYSEASEFHQTWRWARGLGYMVWCSAGIETPLVCSAHVFRIMLLTKFGAEKDFSYMSYQQFPLKYVVWLTSWNHLGLADLSRSLPLDRPWVCLALHSLLLFAFGT